MHNKTKRSIESECTRIVYHPMRTPIRTMYSINPVYFDYIFFKESGGQATIHSCCQQIIDNIRTEIS